jgi:hypothetical protein
MWTTFVDNPVAPHFSVRQVCIHSCHIPATTLGGRWSQELSRCDETAGPGTDEEQMTPQAIPTTYRGRRYRSRLETRWQITFDAYGYEAVYEPQVECPVPYQPDFWLPPFDVYIEVKYGGILPIYGEDHDPMLADLDRLDTDHERWLAFVTETRTDLWVVVGEAVRWIEGRPARPAWGLVYSHRTGSRHLFAWSEFDGTPGPWGTQRRWTIGPVMQQAAIETRDHDFADAA